MNKVQLVALAATLAASCPALAQPVNGKLKPIYGPPLWVNSTPTQFGDAVTPTAPFCDPIGAGIQITLDNSNRAGIGGNPSPTVTTNLADQAAARLVNTGYEIKIPLASIGFDVNNLPPTISIGIAGMITGGDYGTPSNQIIGGVGGFFSAVQPTGTGSANNYPSSRVLDFTTVAGNQYVTVTATTASLTNLEPSTFNGTLDRTFFGTELFAQDTLTNFGDLTLAQAATDSIFRCRVGGSGGSELDAVYARISRDSTGAPAMYLFLAGNYESNFNKVVLFFDSIAGGQNQMRGDNATQTGTFGSVFNGGANAFGPTTSPARPGLKFDAGFEADYFLGFSVGGDTAASPTIFADWQKLRNTPTDTGSSGRFIGSAQASLPIVAPPTPSIPGVLTASDPCPPYVAPDIKDVANGSEIDGLYATRCGNDLYVLVTGNLQNNGNRLDLFFDVGQTTNGSGVGTSNGQNRVRNNNLPFDFGHLNRLGADAADSISFPGMRFSTGFLPDYWMSIKTSGDNTTSGGYNVRQEAWAGVMNSNGAQSDGATTNPAYFEYGSFTGKLKNAANPLSFDGDVCVRFDTGNCVTNGLASLWNPTSIVGIDIQGDPLNVVGSPGSGVNNLPVISEPYSSYAPRLISADVYNPFAVTVPDYIAPSHASLPQAGLIQLSIDNSNLSGVSNSDAIKAGRVATGIEVKVNLAELGWINTSTPIRIGGFLISEDHRTLSNQVIGGSLPAAYATANLVPTNPNDPPLAGDVDVRNIDFQADAITGTNSSNLFYVEVPLTNVCTTALTGACCWGTECVVMSAAQCGNVKVAGTYKGDATACQPDGTCPTAVANVLCCRGATCTYVAAASCTIPVTSPLTKAGVFTSNTVTTACAAYNAGTPSTFQNPCCLGDYNKVNNVGVQDILDFVSDWLAGRSFAIPGGNGTGTPGVSDLLNFFTAWLAGNCP